jgi:hypothetical protein
MRSPRIAALLALFACNSAPATGPAPAPVAPPPAPVAPPPAPAPSPVDAAPIVAPDAQFKVAAYRDGFLHLYALADEIFVSGSGGLARPDARGQLVHLASGLAGQASMAGDEFEAWWVRALGGRWPDNAWLVTEFNAGRLDSPPFVHRRDGDAWKREDNKDGVVYWYYAAVVAWHSGQVLGLREHVTDPDIIDDYEEIPRKIQRQIDAKLAGVRRGFDLLGATTTPTTMVVDRKLREVHRVAAAPTGELFALYSDRDVDGRPNLVQRWGLTGPAAVAGTVDELAPNTICNDLVVRAADDAYVGCSRKQSGDDPDVAVVLHFDGARWSEVPGPPGQEIRGLALAGDELWAVVNRYGLQAMPDILARRPAKDAAWQVVDLPEVQFPDRAAGAWLYQSVGERFELDPGDPELATRAWALEPDHVMARGADDVWVVATTKLPVRGEAGDDVGTRTVVLRSKPSGPPLRMLADEDLTLELLDWRDAPPWQAGAGCPLEVPAYVALRTLPADAAPGQPEPQLEAFVRDNQGLLPKITEIFEVHRRDRRAVGLFTRITAQADADALLAALERAAPGEPRALECRRPRAVRAFDKATGRAVADP